MLGGIRERVLQFALDIERLDPAAGEAAPNERPLAEPQITQIFHQNFFGDNTTLAVGGRDVTQTVSAVPLDVDGLVAALQELGIDKDEQEILVEAVRSDQQDGAFQARRRTPGSNACVVEPSSSGVAWRLAPRQTSS